MPFFIGFTTSLTLILAIGAQNAFVFRQGLMKRYVLSIVLFCALSDALLITIGVYSAEFIALKIPGVAYWIKIAGVAFLIVYGLSRFWAAIKGGGALAAKGENTQSLFKALLICAAFTYLNPHVYLDTMVLMGSLSLPYQGLDKTVFVIGAALASFCFFAALGFGAKRLAPYFQNDRAWQILDFLMGILMMFLAWVLWKHS